jgi:hypothetical protein
MKVSSSDKVGEKLNDGIDTESWLLPFIKMLVYPSGLRELPAKQLFTGSNPVINSIKT